MDIHKATKWVWDRAHELSTWKGFVRIVAGSLSFYYLVYGDYMKSTGVLTASQLIIGYIDGVRNESAGN